MKKVLLSVTLAMLFLAGQVTGQVRFLEEVFTDVQVSSNVMYGANYFILTGSPQLDTLRCDIYEPVGDTMSQRPVVVYVHTGSFLPVPLNGGTTGSKTDSAVVEMCTQFAKRGYVAAAISYRLGWNPAGDQDTRTGTLIQAVYRGLQDSKNAVRFFRNDAQTNNDYKVDPGKISILGQGSGGYIALAYATLDDPDEIFLPKFTNASTGQPYVDTAALGDFDGFGGQTPWNNENFPGVSSDVCLAANLGGALGDSTWLEADGNVPPLVAFHVPSDPFAPYTFGSVIVPTTGDFVVEVSGSYDAIRMANDSSVNDVFINATFNDPYTQRANMINDGHKGLFPLVRPTPESAPWEWWDPNHPNHSNSIQTNPDMSKQKALTYIDTIMGYLNPRIVEACGLPIVQSISENEISRSLNVYPNPATDQLMIGSELNGNKIAEVRMYDISGKRVYALNEINAIRHTIDVSDLPAGLYIMSITTEKGIGTRKVTIK